jgi:hypothetical protein
MPPTPTMGDDYSRHATRQLRDLLPRELIDIAARIVDDYARSLGIVDGRCPRCTEDD